MGLAVETVSRQVGVLKAAGVIALDGARRVMVPDLRALLVEMGSRGDGLIA